MKKLFRSAMIKIKVIMRNLLSKIFKRNNKEQESFEERERKFEEAMKPENLRKSSFEAAKASMEKQIAYMED